jgi:hypothetical protein
MAIAIVPSAPVLVPELAGTAAAEIADLRAAVLAAAKALPDSWIAVGVGAGDEVWAPETTGSFAGYGVDIRVALSPDALSPEANSGADLPLSALIAGWIRGQAQPNARLRVHTYATTLASSEALARGRAMRAELEEQAAPVGILVVADGCHTLTPSAPGGHDPASVPVQTVVDDAVAAGDVAALSGLPAAVVGRVAFAVLAGLAEPGPHSATELYRGAPFGVGYSVGLWRP